MGVQVQKEKKDIGFPTLTVLLMLVFGILGFLAYYSTHETVKDCTGEVTGIVGQEGYGKLQESEHFPEGRYLSTGKYRKYWIEIHVDTDDRFQLETLYASVSYGKEGDELAIHYNPEDPEEYYIGESKKQHGYGSAVVLFVISGLMLALSIGVVISDLVGTDEEKKQKKREQREQKAVERQKKAKERIEKNTKRYTKKYTNPHIREQIQTGVINARITIGTLALGGGIFLAGFVWTLIDLYKEHESLLKHLWDAYKGHHPLLMAIGLTFLVIGVMFSFDFLRMLRNIRPVCSGTRYSAEEIDRMANNPYTVWLSGIEVLATPSALIGLNHGLTVVDCCDIDSISITTIKHRSKYRSWKTYCLIIETKKHKQITLTEYEGQGNHRTLTRWLDKNEIQYKMLNES